ncbi:MAG: hypothetical protein SOZ23_00955 [Methanosphaera sp.]|uniref:hypothetical protein n=1 Tax=Methanosphaera sp. TaxID=2666342 RepID=UPI0025ED1EA3|nr:hypothetical protein [Methanosphaera sp.]MCI5867875.1 hypothetical protein [Methanosphaera sp.]MDD6534885.1 hypothetical protein [Methanosphaera sp.]MDY3955345.1 hypothetical protein [Methanosphaera sp.]
MNMKLNSILAIIASVVGLIFGVSTFLEVFNLSIKITPVGMLIGIISIIAGIVGIWLFTQDHIKAMVMYVLAGVGSILGMGIYGIASCLIFLIAAIVAYTERDEANEVNEDSDVNVFEYNAQMQQPQMKAKDNNLWLIPCAFVIILIVLVVASAMSAPAEEVPPLNVTNLTVEHDALSMYNVSCNVVPLKNYTYLEMAVVFYDSSNSVIGQSTLVWNMNNPAINQTIKAAGTALTNDQNAKPARAEVYFFDEAFSGANPEKAIYNQTVNMTT